jgi:predicted regulator of Ras-like GTPase activity (Roadblock/LC7/MglB family)
MTKTVVKYNVSDLNNLLAKMNEEGSFLLSVLTDSQGFSIAFAATEELDPDKEAAVIAVIQKMTIQVSKQLGMAATQEIMIHDTEGHCLVCRPFEVAGYNLILGTMLNSRQQSYRRLTSRVIADICRVWAE